MLFLRGLKRVDDFEIFNALEVFGITRDEGCFTGECSCRYLGVNDRQGTTGSSELSPYKHDFGIEGNDRSLKPLSIAID